MTGGLGGLVRFRARVSAALPWRVVVTDALGRGAGSQAGQGPAVDWTWDASLVAGTGIRWRIEVDGATPADRDASASRSSGGPLAITGARSRPGDDQPERRRRCRQRPRSPTRPSRPRRCRRRCSTRTGAELAELLPATRLPAGEHTLAFDGLGQPDGVYTVVLTAVDSGGVSVSQQVQITVTRTLGSASLAPAVFTPNGDGKADELQVTFQLAAPATVRLRVLRDGQWVATLFSGPLDAGAQTVGWDGAKRVGVARDGSYAAVIEATDAVGTATITLPFLKDANAPRLRLATKPPRLWVSEAATVTVRVNGSLRQPRGTRPRIPAADRRPPGPVARRRRARCRRQQGRPPPTLTAAADWAGRRRSASRLAGCNRLCATASNRRSACGPSPSSPTTDSATRFSCDAPRTVTPMPSRRSARATRHASGGSPRTCSATPRTRATPPRTRSRSSA